MGKVFVDVGLSLDGFIAGVNRGPRNPLGDGGLEIHAWMFGQQFFQDCLGLGGRGETGRENELVQEVVERSGASIMGKRMFEEGEANWPEEAPFHGPVFVLTHERRAAWPRKGGTTFYFVNDGIMSALQQARRAAGDQDVRISGGADAIRQYWNAGLIEELQIHHAAIFLGDGLRLFEGAPPDTRSVRVTGVSNSSRAVHVCCSIRKA